MEEEWPPFRKTGVFDPYSDDPRLAIKRVTLCPLSGTLVVAGTAGQVVIAKFDTEVLDGPLKTASMNIVSDRDGFVWKGHSQLTPKQGGCIEIYYFYLNYCVIFQATCTNLAVSKPIPYFSSIPPPR